MTAKDVPDNLGLFLAATESEEIFGEDESYSDGDEEDICAYWELDDPLWIYFFYLYEITDCRSVRP